MTCLFRPTLRRRRRHACAPASNARRKLGRDGKGSMSLEFALVGGTFALLLVYSIQAGMVLWTKNAYEVAASQAARCAANSGQDCNSGTVAYAQSVLNKWGVGTLTGTPLIEVKSAVTCSRTAGIYTSVTITSTSGLSWMMPPLNTVGLSATSCYPTAS